MPCLTYYLGPFTEKNSVKFVTKRFNPTCRVRGEQETSMPFKRRVLPNRLILIDSYDITPEEELQIFNKFGGVKSFPSTNHRSRLKNQPQQKKEMGLQELE